MVRPQTIKIKVLDPKYTPEKAHENDACYDLKARLPREIEIVPGEVVTLDTGVFLELPDGWEAQIRPRSGLASKFGLTVTNTPGTIDSGYRGEIKVVLGLNKIMKRNESYLYAARNEEPLSLKDGMRIAQIAFRKVPPVCLEVATADLAASERDIDGLGSTGV